MLRPVVLIRPLLRSMSGLVIRESKTDHTEIRFVQEWRNGKIPAEVFRTDADHPAELPILATPTASAPASDRRRSAQP